MWDYKTELDKARRILKAAKDDKVKVTQMKTRLLHKETPVCDSSTVERNSFETTNSLEEEVDCVRCSRHQSPKPIILTFTNDSAKLVGRSESPDTPDKSK